MLAISRHRFYKYFYLFFAVVVIARVALIFVYQDCERDAQFAIYKFFKKYQLIDIFLFVLFFIAISLFIDFYISEKRFRVAWIVFWIILVVFFTSIIFASLNTARVKSKDAARKAGLGQIRMLLELYFDEEGHKYPVTLEELVPKYIGVLPKDPDKDRVYEYKLDQTSQTYVLRATTDVANMSKCEQKYVGSRLTGGNISGNFMDLDCSAPYICFSNIK